jgi:Tfp pilus assembly protein FimT
MNKQGFSTVELLLYIAIMTVLMGLTTTAVLYDYIRALSAMRLLHEFSMLSTAQDVFVQDMYCASDHVDAWYQLDDHTVIARCGATDVGWTLKRARLVRASGTYDRNKQRWIKRSASVMATGVTHCTFTLIPDMHNMHRIQTVRCVLTSERNEITRSVALRNGRMV